MSAHAQRIESTQNPKLKRAIKRVKQSPAKSRTEGVAWCEGLHLALELLSASEKSIRAGQVGPKVHEVWLPDALWNNPEWQDNAFLADQCDVFELPNGLFSKLSALPSPTGPLVFFEPNAPSPMPTTTTDWVVLDQIQDPGNLGTILRTCAAAGVIQIGLTPGCAWPWGEKALRAGMGAQWGLNFHEIDPTHPWSKQPVLVTHLDVESKSLYDCELTEPTVWVFGNEGQGASSDWVSRATHTVKIPQVEHVESLNVAVSCAVVLFEQRRQRL